MKIIERTHEQYMTEIQQFFEEIKPLLDAGTSFTQAVSIIKGIPNYQCNSGWFKTLKEYAEKQGYVSQPRGCRCRNCKHLSRFSHFPFRCKVHDLEIESLNCTCKWWCEK